jgi:hypothetical protein
MIYNAITPSGTNTFKGGQLPPAAQVDGGLPVLHRGVRSDNKPPTE